MNVDVGDLGVLSVDDLGKLLQGGAPSLNVHEVDKDELEEDPALQGNWPLAHDAVHATKGRAKLTV